MSILLPEGLPARDLLKAEGAVLLEPGVARRPLRIALLNLMPEKIKTENQLARMLGGGPLDVELTLLRTASYQSKNTPAEHMARFYRSWEQVAREAFDALIITGAPVETLPFDQVDYWPELVQV